MPLLKEQLRLNILDVYIRALNGQISISNPPSPPPPGLSSEMAAELATAYDGYAKQAGAGALTSIVTPGLKSALRASLVAPNYSGWALGWGLYWAPVTFTGGGFIPANPIVSGITTGLTGISNDINTYLDPSNFPSTIQDAADRLATILHNWTTKLQVVATTTSSPPVTSTLSVS